MLIIDGKIIANYVEVDTVFNALSNNPVTSKVLKALLDAKQNVIDENHKLNASLISGLIQADGLTIEEATVSGQKVYKVIGINNNNGNVDCKIWAGTTAEYNEAKTTITTNGWVPIITDLITTKADKVINSVSGNLIAMDAEGNLIDSGIDSEKVVIEDNYYKTLDVGNADNLIFRDSEGSLASFGFRSTAGDVSIDPESTAVIKKYLGDNQVVNQIIEPSKKVQVTSDGAIQLNNAVAGNINSLVMTAHRSVVVNQLSDSSSTDTWLATQGTKTIENNNEYTYTVTSADTAGKGLLTYRADNYLISGHKYAIYAELDKGTATIVRVSIRNQNGISALSTATPETTGWTKVSAVGVVTIDSSAHFWVYCSNSAAVGEYFKCRNMMCVDLTQYFNGDQTLIDSITSWDDLVAYDPRFASYVEYNTGEVKGVQPSVKVTGKNLFDKDSQTYEIGYYNQNGVFSSSQSYRCFSLNVIQGTTYTRSTTTQWEGIITFWFNDTFVSGTNIGNGTASFTVPVGCNKCKFVSSVTNLSGDFQIELSSSATPYEPYHSGGTAQSPELFAVGSAADEYNAVSGVTTRNVVTYTFTENTNWRWYPASNCWQFEINANTSVRDCTLVGYIYVNSVASDTNFPQRMTMPQHGKYVYVYDANYVSSDDLTAFKTHMAGKTLYLSTDTPTTSQSTPTQISLQSGSNVAMQTDGGRTVSLSAEYASTKYSLKLVNTHKYLYRHGDTHEIITGSSSVSTLEVDSTTDKLIDLTKWFAPKSVPTMDQFYYMYPTWKKGNIPYIYGKVVNYKGTGIRAVDFNQYNPATKTAKCLGMNKYQICGAEYTGVSYVDVFGDTEELTIAEGGYFTPQKNGYLHVVSNDDTNLCVHLCWRGYRDYGEDKYLDDPYEEEDFDFDVTQYAPNGMNGIWSFDANGKVVGVYDELQDNQYIQRLGRLVFDGSEDWTTYGESGINYRGFKLNNSLPQNYTTPINTSKFGYYSPNGTSSDVRIWLGTNDSKITYICAAKSNSNEMNLISELGWYNSSTDTLDLVAFKQWLHDNPLEIIYDATNNGQYEPTVTEITPALTLNYKVNDFGTEQSLPIMPEDPNAENAFNIPSVELNAYIAYQIDYTRQLFYLIPMMDTLTELVKNYDRIVLNDGTYPKLTSGRSFNVVDQNAEGIPRTYTYGSTGGDANLTGESALIKSIQGTTLFPNQLKKDYVEKSLTGNGVASVTDASAAPLPNLELTAPKTVVLNQAVADTVFDNTDSGEGVVAVKDVVAGNASALRMYGDAYVRNQIIQDGYDIAFDYENTTDTVKNPFITSPRSCVIDNEIRVRGHVYAMQYSLTFTSTDTCSLYWSTWNSQNFRLTPDSSFKKYTLPDTAAASVQPEGLSMLSVQPGEHIVGKVTVQVVDLTQLTNNNTTLINSITSWSDLVALYPEYASYVNYNAGEVVGVQPSIKVTGKNLINCAGGGPYTSLSSVQSDSLELSVGTYTLSCNISETALSSSYVRFVLDLVFNDGSTRTIACNIAGGTSGRVSNTFTTDLPIVSSSVSVAGSISGYSMTVSDIQLELGNTATTYEPYNSIGTASAPSALYGVGTAKDSFDAVSGDVVRKMASVDLGTLGWELRNNYWFSQVKLNNAKFPSSSGELIKAISENYSIILLSIFDGSESNKNTLSMNSTGYVYVNTGSTTTTPTGTLYYELATPTTTPGQSTTISLQAGNNVVTQTDTGKTATLDLSYQATTRNQILNISHKYAYHNGTSGSILELGASSQELTAGRDMLVDITKLYNNDTTAIAGITSWADLVAAVPAYASRMNYNAGQVLGAVPAVHVSGKNLTNPQILINKGGVLQQDGSYYWASNSGVTGSIVDFPSSFTGRISVSFDAKYINEQNKSGIRFDILYTDGTRTTATGLTSDGQYHSYSFSSLVSKQVQSVIFNWSVVAVESYIKNVQVEIGETSTSYEPYHDNGSVTAPETMYHLGTVTDSFNASTGTMTKRVGSVNLGTLDWAAYGTNSVNSTYPYGQTSCYLEGKAIGITNLMTDAYFPIHTTNIDKSIYGHSGNNMVRLIDSSLIGKTAAQVKSALSGIYLYYELAEPTITTDANDVQATSFTDGTNNILQTSTDLSNVGISTNYNGTDYTMSLMTSHKYVYRHDGEDQLLENASTKNVFKNDLVIDLTKMFGTGFEPSISDLYNLFPQWDGYQLPYNEGYDLNYKGTGIKTIGMNLLDIKGRSEGTLDTSIAPRRNFEFDKYYVGLTRNNSKDSNNILEYSLSEHEVKVKTRTGWYGIGFPVRCFPETEYYLNFTLSNASQYIGIGFYDANGNYLSDTTRSNNNRANITTPSKCYIMTIVFTPQTTNLEVTYSNINLNFVWTTGYNNGKVENYVSSTLPLPIETYFPSGMNNVGDSRDELLPKKAVQRIGVVDLGDLNYELSPSGLFKVDFSNVGCEFPSSSSILANISCRLYNNMIGASITGPSGSNPSPDMSMGLSSTKQFYINNLSYTDPTLFKAAMVGVKLYYVLATPIETPITSELDFVYFINDFGEEISLPQNTSPTELITAPFHGLVYYTPDNAREMTRLPENYVNMGTLDNMLNAMNQESGGEFTKQWDSQNYRYNIMYTPEQVIILDGSLSSHELTSNKDYRLTPTVNNPTIILPAITNYAVDNAISIEVNFSSYNKVTFKNSSNVTITPDKDPVINVGDIYRFLCIYSALALSWLVLPIKE